MKERPARTHWIQQIWGGKWRKGVGGSDRGREREGEREEGEREKLKTGGWMDVRGQTAGHRL